ncbi:xylulokinase [Afifella aestuarii]|uniref:xylulokinase n=1 Tax=Afifella aestuarii TaxID=1909496 RepID=UPI000FE39AA8|nr:xylulokinase [Afifella aestuarii]
MYLGIDIGTSSIKVILMTAAQDVLASATAPLDVMRPQPGWSEQDPNAWIAALGTAMDALKRERPAEVAAVKGIGLSGQMHGATLVAKDGAPIRPSILWNDGRSAEEARRLDADPRFHEITGNLVFPGFTAPKLAWVKTHEPENFAATAKVLLPKDFVRLYLTADAATDMSDASGTSWLDVGKRCWSPELLAATDMDESQMPKLYEGSQATGTLRPALARLWGMTGEVVVAAGGGDNAAAACGVGVTHPGAAFVSLGTSGVVFAATEAFAPNVESAVHAFCHALPNTWHQMGVILSAAGSLEWLSRLLKEPVPDLIGHLGTTPDYPAPVLFLPYLSGERTPHNDAAARGVFIGLAQESDRATLTQAVLEGVAFALADCQAVLAAAGTTIPRYLAVGGGSRSKTWLTIMASALNTPIGIPEEGDYGAAFGAARLGLLAAEGGDTAEILTHPPLADTIDPVPALSEAYRDSYERWRALYPAVRDVMR